MLKRVQVHAVTGKNQQEKHALLKKATYMVGRWAGSLAATLVAFGLVAAWVISGPYFGFSARWGMMMNSISSAVTFIMVFLLQRSQIKDSLTMQIKLNEIIGAVQGADNHMINIEDLSESEILSLRENYQKLALQIQGYEEHRGSLVPHRPGASTN